MQQPTNGPELDAEREYRTIEATLLASGRGRWFLAEHGRRARRLDNALLQEAIGRLQSSLRQPPALLGQLQAEIEGLRRFLAETRTTLLANADAAFVKAGGQTAAASILKAAEDLHELAWTLQASHVNAEACERIARNASSIYALSVHQAVTSERAQAYAAALSEACSRLEGLLETIAHETVVDEVGTPTPDGVAGLTALLGSAGEAAGGRR